MLCGYPLISIVNYSLLSSPSQSVTIAFRVICLLLACVITTIAIAKGHGWSRAVVLPIGTFWALYSFRILENQYELLHMENLSPTKFIAMAYGVSFASFLAMAVGGGLDSLRYFPHFTALQALCTCIVAAFARRAGFEPEIAGRLHLNEGLNPIELGFSGATLCLITVWFAGSALRPNGAGVNGLSSLVPRGLARGMLLGLLPVSLALGGYTMLATASRAPIIALIICVGIILMMTRSWKLAALLAMIGTGAVSIRFWESMQSSGANLERLIDFGSSSSDYSSGRTDLWIAAWQIFVRNPINGGALLLEEGIYPHNLFLESLMATGVIGTLPLVVGVGLALVVGWKSTRQSDLSAMVYLMLAQTLVGAMTSGGLFYLPGFWASLGAVAALHGSEKIRLLNR